MAFTPVYIHDKIRYRVLQMVTAKKKNYENDVFKRLSH